MSNKNKLKYKHLYLFLTFLFMGSFLSHLNAQNEIKSNKVWPEGKYEQPIWNWYHINADDSSFKNNEYDFSNWEHVFLKSNRNYKSNIQWFASEISITGEINDYDYLSLVFTDIFSAYEIYWDGEYVGQNGKVGSSKEEEIAGIVYKVIKLPKDYTKSGKHFLKIRLSNYHTNNENPFNLVSLGNSSIVHYQRAYKTSYLLFNSGTLLTAGLFCIAMFLSGRRNRYYLWLALFCIWGFFQGFYSTFILYNEVSVTYINWINFLYEYGRLISIFAFLIFVIYTYEIPKKTLIVSISIFAFIVVVLLNKLNIWLPYINNYDILSIIILSLIVYTVIKKVDGSIPILIGVILWKFLEYSHYIPAFDEHYLLFGVIGQIAFLFCVIISITRKITLHENMLQEIQLRSSRLEVELIKKNIQPHFILNTLQSIINWIKKKPENAVVLINSLADEFKMINQIFDQKFIPLKKEIELCETHLKIMSLRLGAEYKLSIDGLYTDELVPPMIFHTLIENALTHSFKTQEAGVINLNCEKNGKFIKYVVCNSGSRLNEIQEKDTNEIQEGMGIKYIKARLEESYHGKWELNYQLNNNLWEVTIIISN